MNQVNQFEMLISLLTDDELGAVGTLINQESKRRASIRVASGNVQPLTDQEKTLLDRGNSIATTIISYRARTKHSIHVCKLVVDEYLRSK